MDPIVSLKKMEKGKAIIDSVDIKGMKPLSTKKSIIDM